MSKFDFSNNYVLEDDFVKLVPFTEDHFDDFLVISNEENLWTYFLGSSNGKSDFSRYVFHAIVNREKRKQYPFAVFDKVKNQYAGSTRLFDFGEDFTTVRLGYTWYGQDFRGTGINKHCKYLLFQFAFEQMNMERVGLGAHSENKVSIAAMKSVGCKEEGVIRNLFPSIHSSGRSDAILLGLLKKEWFESVESELRKKLNKKI